MTQSTAHSHSGALSLTGKYSKNLKRREKYYVYQRIFDDYDVTITLQKFNRMCQFKDSKSLMKFMFK